MTRVNGVGTFGQLKIAEGVAGTSDRGLGPRGWAPIIGVHTFRCGKRCLGHPVHQSSDRAVRRQEPASMGRGG